MPPVLPLVKSWQALHVKVKHVCISAASPGVMQLDAVWLRLQFCKLTMWQISTTPCLIYMFELQDIQSGNCFVHNGLLFDHVQKGVFQAPWRMPIAPFWSPSHKNAYAMLRAVTQFVANPSFGDLNKVALAALWG